MTELRVVEYRSFLKQLQADTQLARCFLTQCYHAGYKIGNINRSAFSKRKGVTKTPDEVILHSPVAFCRALFI